MIKLLLLLARTRGGWAGSGDKTVAAVGQDKRGWAGSGDKTAAAVGQDKRGVGWFR